MRRKLVKQGAATYTTSLPKDWVERFNLKSGDEIDIEESGMQLILSSIQKQKKYETLSYDLSKVPESLIHELLVSLYKSGVRDMDFKGVSSEKMISAKEVINNTIGFEILGMEKDKMHISDLGTSDEESLIKAEQQIYWRLLHMIDRVLDKASKEKEIHDIDLEINKLSFFIQRNLAAKFSSSPKNFLVYEKAAALESLGDFLRSFKMYSSLSEEDRKYLRSIYEILEILRSQKTDMVYFNELKKKLESIKSLAEKFKKSNRNNSALAAILLYKNVEQLFDIDFTLNIGNFKE